jgi:hypothetical protein
MDAKDAKVLHLAKGVPQMQKLPRITGFPALFFARLKMPHMECESLGCESDAYSGNGRERHHDAPVKDGLCGFLEDSIDATKRSQAWPVTFHMLEYGVQDVNW